MRGRERKLNKKDKNSHDFLIRATASPNFLARLRSDLTNGRSPTTSCRSSDTSTWTTSTSFRIRTTRPTSTTRWTQTRRRTWRSETCPRSRGPAVGPRPRRIRIMNTLHRWEGIIHFITKLFPNNSTLKYFFPTTPSA